PSGCGGPRRPARCDRSWPRSVSGEGKGGPRDETRRVAAPVPSLRVASAEWLGAQPSGSGGLAELLFVGLHRLFAQLGVDARLFFGEVTLPVHESAAALAGLDVVAVPQLDVLRVGNRHPAGAAATLT